jgi:hypothetical protein
VFEDALNVIYTHLRKHGVFVVNGEFFDLNGFAKIFAKIIVGFK